MQDLDERTMRAGIVTCPGCLRSYRVDLTHVGSEGKCSGCNRYFEIVRARPIETSDSPIVFKTPLTFGTSFMREGCEGLTRSVFRVLDEAGEPITALTVSRFLREILDARAGLPGCTFRQDILARALRRTRGDAGRELFVYFCERVPEIGSDVLRMAEAAIAGVLAAIDGYPLAALEERRPAARWGLLKLLHRWKAD